MAISLPCSKITIGDKEVEVFRCQTDEGLVIRADGYDSQPLFQAHAGHKIKTPVILQEWEIETIREELEELQESEKNKKNEHK